MALKFYSSIRLDTRKIEIIKEGDRAIGSRIRVKIVKNKVAPPFRVAEFDVMASGGISREGNILDVGIETGVIQKTGAFLRYDELMLGQGREAAKAYLEQHPELQKKIVAEVMEKSKTQKPLIAVGGQENEEEELAA